MAKERFKYKPAPILRNCEELTSHFSILTSAHHGLMPHFHNSRNSLILLWFCSRTISQIQILPKHHFCIAVSARTLSAGVEGYSRLMDDDDEGELSAPLPFIAQQ